MKDRSVRDYLSAIHELSRRIDVSHETSYKVINDAIRDMKTALGWSQGTVYKYAVCIKHFYRWACREEHIPRNPYPFTEWRKARPKTPKFLTEDMFSRIICDPLLSQQELTLLYLLWDTGARIGEIAALERENIDLERGLVNIPYEISKGSYSYRDVPVTAETTALLKKQAEMLNKRGVIKGWFINPQNDRITLSGLQKVIAAIGLRSSPLRPAMRLSAHQFRHSAGIRWLSKGVPQVIVQKWLGHQSLQMTSHYVNLDSVSSLIIFDKYCRASESLAAQGM